MPLRVASTGSEVSRAEHRDADLLAELLELIDRRRPLQVGRDEAGLPALGAQHERELRRGRRLARALEARQEDHAELAERERRRAFAHQAS